MSVIFPGNYVAHLNAYRDQGVYALPGVEFYQIRGAAIVSADVTGSGTLTPEILSPDLRQDDKPRLDRPFVIPAGATVYRSAISTSNLATTGTSTVAVDGLTESALEASAAAVAGELPAAGATTTFDGFATVSVESSDATISVAHSGDLTMLLIPMIKPAVIVEVCYYLDGAAPDTDDINLPYQTEAGSRLLILSSSHRRGRLNRGRLFCCL